MTEQPKFDFGDPVRIIGKEHKGRTGCVVSINGPESCPTYTVEFGDGSDAEIAEEFLSQFEGAD